MLVVSITREPGWRESHAEQRSRLIDPCNSMGRAGEMSTTPACSLAARVWRSSTFCVMIATSGRFSADGLEPSAQGLENKPLSIPDARRTIPIQFVDLERKPPE
ncbi:MAG: hypothetical protein Ct9H300mP15_20240 [Gemmatimonadota bacterium]|nr:MAG: hypothetical protein Ct9H300mP15_20240 [Gemmatimonadota bacterium]